MRSWNGRARWIFAIGTTVLLLVIVVYHSFETVPVGFSRYPPKREAEHDLKLPILESSGPLDRDTEEADNHGENISDFLSPLSKDHSSPRNDLFHLPKMLSKPPTQSQSHQRKRTSRPILILQHFPPSIPNDPLRGLHEASEKSHERYALAHGYLYMADRGEYIQASDTPNHGGDENENEGHQVNKIHALLIAVYGEVRRLENDRVDWIFYTDADTLILNPSIPLHALLPPKKLQPSPQILASQDLNGLNTGIVLLRPSITVIKFLLECLTLSANLQETRSKFRPSDQWLFGEVLRRSTSFRTEEWFREIPQDWFNAYNILDPAQSRSQKLSKGDHIINHHNEGINVITESFIPKLQIHLVSESKYTTDWGMITEAAEKVYENARQLAVDLGSRKGVNGLELRSERESCLEIGERWWSGSSLDGSGGGRRSGISEIRFRVEE